MDERPNVIPFPNPARQRIKQARGQQALRKRDLRRLRAIEERGNTKKGPLFVALQDRITAGMATGRMLSEAKASGVTMREVKEAFADRFGASGRIDRYSLSRQADPTSKEARERAGRKLMQKVSGYLKLAEILAESMDRDVDDAKIEVLKGTSLWSRGKRPTSINDVDERAWHLALMLREMGQSIIRREKLKDLFAMARRIPGQWDIHAECFRPGSMSCLYQPRYEEWFEVWEDSPPLPSVALARLKVAQISTPILAATVGVPDKPRNYLKNREDFEGETHDTCVTFSREIRLCLGPIRNPDEIGAMFESRAHVEVEVHDQNSEFHIETPIVPSASLDTLVGLDGHIFLKNAWRRFRFLNYSDLDEFWDYCWPCTPLNRANPLDIEHYYLSWTPVTTEYVAYWLDRKMEHYQFFGAGPRPAAKERWYPLPSLAHLVERDLTTGAIEAALAKEVAKIRDALCEREQEWRSSAQDVTREMIGLWNNDMDGET